MLLEARPIGLFSNTAELYLDGQPIGNLKPISFSQGFTLNLLGQTLTFEKPSWMRTHFVLKDEAAVELGSVTLDGWLRRRWWICCGSDYGSAILSGWPNSVFKLTRDEKLIATARTPNLFCRTWQLVADETLSIVHVVLVGLAYNLSRQRGPDKINQC